MNETTKYPNTGDFDTLEGARSAANMLEVFAHAHGCTVPKFDLKKVAENIYRLTQKNVKFPE
jgi:hypothetical protein